MRFVWVIDGRSVRFLTMATSIRRHALGLTWLEESGLRRAAHGIVHDGRVWLIDPFEDPVALGAATELGRPAAVLQLLDRHERDCAGIAQRLEIDHLRLPAVVPDSPFEVVRVLTRRWWQEVALWWEAKRTLVVAEAVGTAPAFALHRRLGVHPMLRLSPPRAALTAHTPEWLLAGHGPPLESGAALAISEALAHARSDIPSLIARLPSLLAGR